MTEVRLTIDDTWRARLLELRRTQGSRSEVEELLGCEAVLLYGWLGHTGYLGLDGRLVAWAEPDDRPPEIVTDPAHAARLVVNASGWLELTRSDRSATPWSAWQSDVPHVRGPALAIATGALGAVP